MFLCFRELDDEVSFTMDEEVKVVTLSPNILNKGLLRFVYTVCILRV